jgi:hypothetical protein
MSDPFCPILHPTLSEFSNFESYISIIESLHPNVGMVKIVPPTEWKARKKGYKSINPIITHPVKQIVSGLAGIYQVILVSEPGMKYTSFKSYAQKRDLKDNIPIDEVERLVRNT